MFLCLVYFWIFLDNWIVNFRTSGRPCQQYFQTLLMAEATLMMVLVHWSWIQILWPMIIAMGRYHYQSEFMMNYNFKYNLMKLIYEI